MSSNRKTFKGTIVSTAMEKTVVVDVARQMQHPKYKKWLTVNKRYKAHVDAPDEYAVGDTVRIEETRPTSKHKRWRVVRRIDRGSTAAVQNDERVPQEERGRVEEHIE